MLCVNHYLTFLLQNILTAFLLVTHGPDEKAYNADEESTPKEKQEEETSKIHDEKDEQVELTLVDLLKGWRSKHGDKSCRKTLRGALRSIGIEGNCIIGEDEGE